MLVKARFVASDGREFATEEDCILYEVEINPEKYEKFHNGIIIIDCRGIILNDGCNMNYDDAFFSAYSIIVFDKDRADSYFGHLINEFDAVCPSSNPGIYTIDGANWYRKISQFVNSVNIMNQLYLKHV